ncbi:hypothetical protein ACFO9Q_05380 [Paenibacillus sp. GCM10023252]|uniref:hypothetical protein n=1 Tax=Paenibacillus sp. GCM10023252 TaxID=3252649 RepID=UPI00361A03E6
MVISAQSWAWAIGIQLILILILATLIAWLARRKGEGESERWLFLRVLALIFLGALSLRLDLQGFSLQFGGPGIALPIGLIAAYLLQARMTSRWAARAAVAAGGLMFLLTLYPLQQPIDERLYPRDEISTYMAQGAGWQEEGTHILFTKQDKIFLSLTEQSPETKVLYDALLQAQPTLLPAGWEAAAGFVVYQSNPRVKFKELIMEGDAEGKYILLSTPEGKQAWAAPEPFQQQFKTILTKAARASTE